MYRLLIAEVDLNIINQITTVIKEDFKEIEIVGIASSGRQLVQMSERLQPDIVFSAVKMPHLHGLEAIAKIKKMKPSVHVIIISLYDYFDFIREAMSLGVDDYFVKPIKMNQLSSSLRIIVNKIAERQNSHQIQMEKEVFYSQVKELTEYSFVYSFLYNEPDIKDMLRYRCIFGLEGPCYVMNIEINKDKYNTILDVDVDNQKLYSCIKECISRTNVCVVGPKILKRVIVIVGDKPDKDKKEIPHAKQAKKLAKELLDELKLRLDLYVCIAVGSPRELENIHISYEETLKALKHRNHLDIVDVKDIEYDNSSNINLVEHERKLMEFIKYGNEEALETFYDILNLLAPLRFEVRKNKIMELIVLSSHVATLGKKKDSNSINYISCFEEMQNIGETELNAWAFRKFSTLVMTVRKERGAKKSAFVNTAIEYLETRYIEDISLEEIAKQVGVTPQHFSKVFKEEMNLNYIEWITKLRINKAKELMNDLSKPIKEICFMVGYKDPNYFSRIFKRTEGISPTQYLKQREELEGH